MSSEPSKWRLEQWAAALTATAAAVVASGGTSAEGTTQLVVVALLGGAAYIVFLLASGIPPVFGMGGAAVLALAFGVWVGAYSASRDEAFPLTGSNQILALHWPEDWYPPDTAPGEIPGLLELRPGTKMTVAPMKADSGVLLVAGMVDKRAASSSLLLPRTLLARISPPTRTGTPIHLRHGLDVYQYRRLRLSDATGELSVLVGPTDEGVAIAACQFGLEASRDDERECERVAHTLDLKRPTGTPLGPQPDHAQALNAMTHGLRRSHRGWHSDLLKAETADEQADAIEKLMDEFRHAADALRRSKALPYDRAAIVGALYGLDAAYSGVGSALGGDDHRRGELRRAMTRLRSSYRKLREQIESLEKAGYAVT